MQGTNLQFVLVLKPLFAFTERKKKTKSNEENSTMKSPNLVIPNAFC